MRHAERAHSLENYEETKILNYATNKGNVQHTHTQEAGVERQALKNVRQTFCQQQPSDRTTPGGSATHLGIVDVCITKRDNVQQPPSLTRLPSLPTLAATRASCSSCLS